MKLSELQPELLAKHEAVFYVLVNISNQFIRQEQLRKILVDSGYCKHNIAATRLFKTLEDAKLLKRTFLKKDKTYIVLACKPAIRAILGDKVANIKIETRTQSRNIRNYIKSELFYRYFVLKNETLEAAVKSAKSSCNNLFNDTNVCYDYIHSEQVAELLNNSFNFKNCKLPLQREEYLKLKQQRTDHAKKSAHTHIRGHEQYNYERELITFEDLKMKEIYLTNMSFHRKNKESHEITMILDFKVVASALDPKNRNIADRVTYLNQFVRDSFELKSIHSDTVIDNNRITKIEVNIDIVCADSDALQNLSKRKIMRLVDKFYSRQRDYRYYSNDIKFKINLLHLDFKR